MAIEQTLVLCKPDAVERGLVGLIIARFEQRGLTIVGLKLVRVDEALALRQYAEHAGKTFFRELVGDLSRGPVVALVVSGADAIGACRQTIGAADPRKAAPGSLRADLALTVRHNIVHASDSVASAEREIHIWFAAGELQPANGAAHLEHLAAV